MTERTEFGVPRSDCACFGCQMNCKFMPGFLIPADLERMIPADADPFVWAEANLLASPGALAMKDGVTFRIPTLVPAVKPDGSCINLTPDGLCGIHDVSPFGCAFFSCQPEAPGLTHQGLIEVCKAFAGGGRKHYNDFNGLYSSIWAHLKASGKVQLSPDVLRGRMARFWNSLPTMD